MLSASPCWEVHEVSNGTNWSVLAMTAPAAVCRAIGETVLSNVSCTGYSGHDGEEKVFSYKHLPSSRVFEVRRREP